MSKLRKHAFTTLYKRTSKRGLSPGSLVFTGKQRLEKARLSIIFYNQHEHFEYEDIPIEELVNIRKKHTGVCWLNVEGLHDEQIIEQIGDIFNIHRLSLEDVLNTGQRPKLDETPEYVFSVLKMFNENEDEQISFILQKDVLITFQERPGDVFDFVRKRIREGKGYVRKRNTGYLMYALFDAIIDEYFAVLENIGERIEQLEDTMLENPDDNTLRQLHILRRDLTYIRRAIYPAREVVSRFAKLETPFILPDTHIFISDLYDHSIQVIDTIEILRDMSSGLLDLYMNSLSNRMNNVMKVLTIIATIFIPLTFIAGVYGMNFENMPELEWPWAYFAVMGIMTAIALGMLYYFKRKKWL
jgi:magnesium transporter